MLSQLLALMRIATARRWLFISLPVVLGCVALIVGLQLLPQKPSQFFANTIPYLELNLVTHCADERDELGVFQLGKRVAIDELITHQSRVYLSRTGASTFELIIDVYGLIGKRDGMFAPTSRVRDWLSGGVVVGNVTSDDKTRLPNTVAHYCDELRIVVNPDDSLDVEATGEFYLQYADGELRRATLSIRSPGLAEQPIQDAERLLIRDRFAARGFQFELPPTDAKARPPRLAGVRLAIDCEQCLRGNRSLADMALSLFLIKRGGSSLADRQRFLPVHAVANEQFVPVKWDGDTNDNRFEILEKDNDRILNAEAGGSVLTSTWLDYDAERVRSSRYTLAGVIIGLGLTLLVEALIAALYHLFHVRGKTPG